METRYCYKCDQEKPKKGFCTRGMCKNCGRKMPKTLILTIYCSQKQSSKQRNMPLPTYTFEEFRKWIITETNFKELYLNWKRNGMEKDLKPSVDRIDENKSYTLDNIQLMTWKENKAKGEQDCKEGKRYSAVRSVTCVHLDTEEFVNQYHSLHEAYRQTGIRYNSIASACTKTFKANGYKFYKAKQYKWAFTLDYMNLMVQQICQDSEKDIDLQTEKIKPSQIHYDEDTCLIQILNKGN